MKRLILYITFLPIFISCENRAETNQNQTTDDINHSSEVIQNDNDQHKIDSLVILKNDLDIELELLKKNFGFKRKGRARRAIHA